MTEQINYQRLSTGTSVLALASELSVRHTLLPLLLNGERKPDNPNEKKVKGAESLHVRMKMAVVDEH